MNNRYCLKSNKIQRNDPKAHSTTFGIQDSFSHESEIIADATMLL